MVGVESLLKVIIPLESLFAELSLRKNSELLNKKEYRLDNAEVKKSRELRIFFVFVKGDDLKIKTFLKNNKYCLIDS